MTQKKAPFAVCHQYSGLVNSTTFDCKATDKADALSQFYAYIKDAVEYQVRGLPRIISVGGY